MLLRFEAGHWFSRLVLVAFGKLRNLLSARNVLRCDPEWFEAKRSNLRPSPGYFNKYFCCPGALCYPCAAIVLFVVALLAFTFLSVAAFWQPWYASFQCRGLRLVARAPSNVSCCRRPVSCATCPQVMFRHVYVHVAALPRILDLGPLCPYASWLQCQRCTSTRTSTSTTATTATITAATATTTSIYCYYHYPLHTTYYLMLTT